MLAGQPGIPCNSDAQLANSGAMREALSGHLWHKVRAGVGSVARAGGPMCVRVRPMTTVSRIMATILN